MRLVRLQFKSFSQGSDIKADIRQGWCAGVTALVSHTAGSPSVEDGLDDQAWAIQAFKKIGAVLDGINNKSVLITTESLQGLLGKVKTKEDVCGKIHQATFNGRECKVLMSTTFWVPLLGYVSYAWQSKWVINHVGYLIRSGSYMLIFDPNYGLGLFQITDSQPLTLTNLTNAIMGLAWAQSAASYYLSTTAAVAVIDEDSLGLRISDSMEQKARELSEMAKHFNFRRSDPV